MNTEHCNCCPRCREQLDIITDQLVQLTEQINLLESMTIPCPRCQSIRRKNIIHSSSRSPDEPNCKLVYCRECQYTWKRNS